MEADGERAVSEDVVIIGAGMHPWGKWGRNFVGYGVAAAQEALRDAGIDWRDVQFVSGAATMRNGYPGYVAGATFAQALGWQGAQVNTSYAACASGSQALAAARSKILSGECEVALVIGANDTVNPAARTNKSSPIYGMPILNVDQAKQAYVIKRGQGKGYSGVENELFFADNTNLVYGDAQKVMVAMIQAVKSLEGGGH
mgnify:CR=1 FL=1